MKDECFEAMSEARHYMLCSYVVKKGKQQGVCLCSSNMCTWGQCGTFVRLLTQLCCTAGTSSLQQASFFFFFFLFSFG